MDIFVNLLSQGQQIGPLGSVTLNEFGWVLTGGTESLKHNVAHHVVAVSCYDLLRRSWVVEEYRLMTLH